MYTLNYIDKNTLKSNYTFYTITYTYQGYNLG